MLGNAATLTIEIAATETLLAHIMWLRSTSSSPLHEHTTLKGSQAYCVCMCTPHASTIITRRGPHPSRHPTTYKYISRARQRRIQVAVMSSYRSKNHCTVFASTAEDTAKRSSHCCTVHGRYNLELHTNFYEQAPSHHTPPTRCCASSARCAGGQLHTRADFLASMAQRAALPVGTPIGQRTRRPPRALRHLPRGGNIP